MAHKLVRYDSKSSRKYLQSVRALQEDRRKNEKAKIYKSLYECRDGKQFVQLLRRSGIIDEHNTILIGKRSHNLKQENQESIQNFHHVSNAQFHNSSVYQRLEPNLNEIRLVEVLPSSFEEPIKCTLVNHISLRELNVTYSALSYAVGDVSDCLPIQLNGSEFWVTKNLEAALRHIRRPKKSRMLWIDQICINQVDHAERSEQVLLMCDIYSNAEQTLVWLGDQPTHAAGLDFAEEIITTFETELENMPPVALREGSALTAVFDGLKQLNPAGQKSPYNDEYRHVLDLFGSTEIMNVPMRRCADFIAKSVTTTAESAKYVALFAVTMCLYWQRSWIWQEVALSVEPLILSRTKTMHWNEYNLALRILNASVASLGIVTQLPQEVLSLQSDKSTMRPVELNMLRETWWHSSISLRQALTFSRRLAATDLRDKVYGVLGIVSEAYRIIPDYRYSMKPSQVFLQATVRSILVDNSLDIISDGQETSGKYRQDLPSWVPDFSVANRRKSLIPALPNSREEKSLFNATPNSELYAEFLKSDRERNSPVLQLSGILLIKSFHPDDLGPTAGEGAFQKCVRFLYSRCPLASDFSLSVSPGESILGSSIRTLLLGLQAANISKWAEQSDKAEAEFMRNGVFTDDLLQNLDQVENSHEWRFMLKISEHIMGMVPAETAPKDGIAFFMGSKVPFVVRRRHNHDHGYRLVGPCYVHGYMYGRILSDLQQQKVTRELFNIY